MKDDAALDRLGTREVELATVAARGRRRSLVILVLACIPGPFVVGWLNDDMSLVAVIPFVSVVGGISYSWSKWMRRPEDSQSIAFVGLGRRQRGVAYRSLVSGRAIEDPIVLTIVESMHQHAQRTGWTAALALAGLTASTVLLVSVGGGAGGWPALAATIAGGAFVLATGWWITRRAGQVILRSDPVR